MSPFYRWSLFVWILLRDLPPISPGRLLMPVVFLCSWTLLRALGAVEQVAFVWSAVFAQSVHVWSVLPVTVRRQHRVFGRVHGAVRVSVLMAIALLLLQVWWSEPWLTQRLLSVYCAIYATVMALGVWGDRFVLDGFVPVEDEATVPLAFRRHLLKLYALMGILVVVINETLMRADMALGASVVALSMLPLVLHYCFEIILRLTHPPLD